jgi:hypothetical protein
MRLYSTGVGKLKTFYCFIPEIAVNHQNINYDNYYPYYLFLHQKKIQSRSPLPDFLLKIILSA